jgi:hypothetical protein
MTVNNGRKVPHDGGLGHAMLAESERRDDKGEGEMEGGGAGRRDNFRTVSTSRWDAGGCSDVPLHYIPYARDSEDHLYARSTLEVLKAVTAAMHDREQNIREASGYNCASPMDRCARRATR